jgi:hypothetical protein
MRSLFENKRLVVLLSLLTLGVLVLLARGLNDIPFHERQTFVQAPANGIRAVPIQIIQTITDVPLGLLLGMWTIVIFIFVLLGFLMSPEWRKRLIRIVIRVGLTYWALYIVFTRYRDLLAQLGVNPADPNNGDMAAATNAQAPPAFASPQTLTLASYIVSFAVLLIVLGRRAYTLWNELRGPGAQPLKKIARIARSSIDDLTAGRESTDVIMNCYYRMSDVVSDKRRLERSASMTPGEFAARLEKEGLPSDAVQGLTHLFEGVRYGDHRSGPVEVKQAVASLNAILAYCGESA